VLLVVLLQHLESLMNPSGNYVKYRRLLAKRTLLEPTIPFLGLFLRDLTFIEDGNMDTLECGCINMKKKAMIGSILRSIKSFQSVPFKAIKDPIPPLLKQLAALPRLSEQQLDRLSETVRPAALSSPLPSQNSGDSQSIISEASTFTREVDGDWSSSDVSEMMEMPVPEGDSNAVLGKYM